MRAHVGQVQYPPCLEVIVIREEGLCLGGGELPPLIRPRDLRLGGVLEQLAVASQLPIVRGALRRAVAGPRLRVGSQGVLARVGDSERFITHELGVLEARGLVGFGEEIRQRTMVRGVLGFSLERVADFGGWK